nr:cytochrome B5-like protein [Ipomoea batatas]
MYRYLIGICFCIFCSWHVDQPQKLQANAQSKVFDVTSYVEEHPGGDAILAHAGDDSTEGFYGPQHATRVFEMIDDFCIGELEK